MTGSPRRLIAVLALCAATITLASCGGGGGAPLVSAASQSAEATASHHRNPKPTSTPTPSPSATPTPKPTTAPTTAPTAAPTPTSVPVSSGNVAQYAGCPIFTAGDYYNAPVTTASLDPNSAAFISGNYAAGNTAGISMFFPSHEYVNVATNSTPLLTVIPTATYHASEFNVPYPWASTFQIENAPSDEHSMVLQKDTCHLYEAYQTVYNASANTLSAYSGWNWDLTKSFVVLPKDTPSAMASGLSLFAGMVKWEEVQAGSVNHALNIALPAGTLCYQCFVTPASDTESYAFRGTSAYQLPYGAHLRLKASVSISGFSPQAQIILRAMQTYGVFIADTGCCMEMYDATPLDGNNAHWDASGINAALGSLRVTNFDVLAMPPIQHY